MGVGELVGKMLAEEHADLLGQAVRWLAEQLMQAEPTAAAGPSYGQCHPDRAARRNGYRQRARGTPGSARSSWHP
jgi:transposase-like protein